MLEGYTYDVEYLRSIFDPKDVFIKVNYIDHNGCTKRLGLQDLNNDAVMAFVDDLKNYGFKYAYRHPA